MIPYWRPDTPIRPPLVTTCVARHRDTTSLIPLRDGMLIGRDRSCDIVFPDPHVARRHARLRCTPEGLVVDDLHSENGTWVAHKMVAGGSAPLHLGGSVSLGESRIQFVHEVPAPPPEGEVADLLAAICDAPDDDEPRLVLADLLTARGDPRGEFIACQVAAEFSVNTDAGARADALLRQHELSWLAPLPVPAASWTFRRGFLDCLWVMPGQSVAALRGIHPLRAVVEIG